MAKDQTQSKVDKSLENNPFPIMSVDPKEKEKDSFGMKAAKSIFWQGVSKDMSSNRRVIAQENRDYGSNRQDINKFKPRLDLSIENEGDGSLLNIDWAIAVPGKKFVDTLVGDMINQDHKIQFNAIDSYSKKKTTAARDKFYGEIVRNRDIQEMEEASGMVLEKRSTLQPQSKEEVDIHMDLDYKQAVEIAFEDIVDFELENNDWEKKVKARVIRDIVENNKGAVRLYFNKNNEVKMRYCDAPVSLYTSYTNEPDYSDTEYEAELVMLSIRDLKERDVHNKITEKQWFDLAKSNGGKYDNRKWSFGSTYDMSNTYDNQEYSYDDYRIEVLDFIFYTNDRITRASKKDKHGGKHFTKKPYGYKKPQRSTKEIDVVEKEIEMSYEGIWAVNSDVLIGYGRSKNILRPQTDNNKSISPKLLRRYVIFEPNLRNGTSKSYVDVIKPSLDTIQLLVLRKRHIIAEMTPSGIAVDINGLTDVMTALSIDDPLEIVKMYKQKGVLYFSRTDVNGDPANGLPVQELNNPFEQKLVAIDNAIINEIELIRGDSGVNDARDGSSPDKDALVGIEKMRLLASNNTTREMYKGFLDGIFAPMGAVLARMIQYKIQYGGGISAYDNIIGELAVKELEFNKDMTMAQLGVKIEALPTDEQIQSLLDLLNISLQQKEIRPEDVFEIKRVMNIKKAERLLIYRRKKYSEEQMAEMAQREEITAKREEAAAMASAEAQKVKDQSAAEAKIQELQAEKNFNKEFNDHETNNKIKLIDRENYWKEKMLEKQLEATEGDAGNLGVDKPRVMSNPGGAIQRTDNINP